MATVNVVISVRDDHLAHMPALVNQLVEAGLTDIHSLSAVGIITGALEEAKLADIALIDGVGQVQRSQTYRLPPTDPAIK